MQYVHMIYFVILDISVYLTDRNWYLKTGRNLIYTNLIEEERLVFEELIMTPKVDPITIISIR